MEARTKNNPSLHPVLGAALESLRHKVAALLQPEKEAERQNCLYFEEKRAFIGSFLTDTSRPMEMREQIGRDIRDMARAKDESQLWKFLFWAGGLGFYSWCHARCPDGRLDAYLAAEAAQAS